MLLKAYVVKDMSNSSGFLERTRNFQVQLTLGGMFVTPAAQDTRLAGSPLPQLPRSRATLSLSKGEHGLGGGKRTPSELVVRERRGGRQNTHRAIGAASLRLGFNRRSRGPVPELSLLGRQWVGRVAIHCSWAATTNRCRSASTNRNDVSRGELCP